uniref:SH3 domain-containing protein n=1 Tax=Angiostrongylus cantonensis TaxID=6313 RepID=A0A0K0CWC0_ANGCA
MSTSFDPYDWASLYFGKMDRDEAARILSEPDVSIGTFLIRDIPYRKGQIEQVVGIYRFEGERETDLSFEMGETLEIIAKPEPGWWQARNALNATGLVPAVYVRPIDENCDRQLKGHSQSSLGSSPPLPALAKAIFDRQPNAYDPSQLKLKKGQQVRITKKLMNGMYEGELDGKVGIVPFTYVRFAKADAK